METTESTRESCSGAQSFTDWKRHTEPNLPSCKQRVREYGNDIDKPDTNNATKLYNLGDLSNFPRKEKWLRRMDLYNSGISNRDWTNDPYITYLTNRHMTLALCNQLDLTVTQTRNVYHRVMQLDLDNWGYPASLVAFCVCAVSVHHDDTGRSFHYNQNNDQKDSLFLRVLNDLDVRPKIFRRVYSKYQNYLRTSDGGNFDYFEFEKRPHDRGI